MTASMHKNAIVCSLLGTLLPVVLHVRCAAAADKSVAPSLRSDAPFSGQLHRGFNLNDGLPSNWINDVIQTRDDYIWIATDNGLVRYDGLQFKLYNRTGTQQLSSNEIRTVYEDSDGRLWIGTTSGLTRFTPGRPGRFEKVRPVSGKTVRTVYEDSANTLWVGTLDETYVQRDGLDFEVLDGAPENVRAFCEDKNGTLWLGANSGLFRCLGTTFERIVHERLPVRTSPGSGIPQTRVNAIFADRDGGLWIGANRALLHFQNGQFTSRGRELDSQQVYDVLQTRSGDLYVAARFGVYRSADDGPFEQVSTEESAFCLMEDREGSLWIGHGDNRGLHRYRNNPAQDVGTETRVRCVYEDSGGDVWFGSNRGLHHLRNGVIRSFGVADGLPDPRVQTIAESSDETLWIGTARGFVKCSGTDVTSDDISAMTSELNVGVALEDASGALWFSLSNAGGFAIKDGAMRELQEFGNGRIHWFHEDADGRIWIGHESGLFQNQDGKIRKISDPAFESLNHPRFLCHFAAADGTLWMGTSNGIVRHQSGHFEVFSPECGLRADNIERMVADNDGNLWFGGRDGLFYADISELEAVAAGRVPRVTSYRVEGFERFPPLSAFSQGSLVSNDMLWLVGEHGLVKMPIEPFQRRPRPPTVKIEHVTLSGVAANFEEHFNFIAGARRLAIQFAVTEFLSPEHIQVRYRLDGHDEDWVDADADRVAWFTDLRPGQYRFRVSARSGNGKWVETDPGMSFTVLPRWWESMWLRVIAVFIAAVATIGYFRYRMRKFRRQNELLQREITSRERAETEARDNLEQLGRVSRAASMGEITTSIAHEIKQPLFAIVSNAQTAQMLLKREEPDIEEVSDALNDIADDGIRASSIIDHIRSLVKKEDRSKKPVDLNDIARDVIKLIGPEILRRGLVLNADLAPDLPSVMGDTIELQQVVMNLLINGAQAMKETDFNTRQLTLRTASQNGSVTLSVRDHGHGVPAEKLGKLFEPFFTTKSEGTGMGLAINRTIVEAHGGSIRAEANEDFGMTFHVVFPVFNETTS